jgi:GIY-YIG catalytic domain
MAMHDPEDPQTLRIPLKKSFAARAQEAQTAATLDVRTRAFLAQARETHGARYDYTEFAYVNSATKGKILCSLHGAFWQTPGNHMNGRGCPACAIEGRKVDTFKRTCQRLGVNYWRALKRREAGMPDEKIFAEASVRAICEINPITVWGVTYPNLQEAVRVLQPPAHPQTISRWIAKGLSPEQAFRDVPNPGYAAGIVYLITHRASGKRYVGLTIQPLAQRWKNHLEQAWAGHVKGVDSLHEAIRTYGSEAFEIQQIDQGTTKKDLEQKERQWIKTYGTLIPDGYNISSGGVSGGSLRKPTVVDGLNFDSFKDATAYVAKTRQISLAAAAVRIRHGRIDVKTPAKRGESLVKTKIYKTWSSIVHVATNPKSKDAIPGISVYPPWRDFTTFCQDVGEPPNADMAFVRLNKAKGFFPDNCAWVSKTDAVRQNARWQTRSHPPRKQRAVHSPQQLWLWEN